MLAATPEADGDDVNLLWVGSTMRGLQHMVEIFPRLRQYRKDAKLFIVSDFEAYYERLQWSHYIHGLHLQQVKHSLLPLPGVYNLGPLSEEAMDELPAMDLVVYPCDPALQIPFTFQGMRLLEKAIFPTATTTRPFLTSAFPQVLQTFPGVKPMGLPIVAEDWARVIGAGEWDFGVSGPASFGDYPREQKEFFTGE